MCGPTPIWPRWRVPTRRPAAPSTRSSTRPAQRPLTAPSSTSPSRPSCATPAASTDCAGGCSVAPPEPHYASAATARWNLTACSGALSSRWPHTVDALSDERPTRTATASLTLSHVSLHLFECLARGARYRARPMHAEIHLGRHLIGEARGD